VIEGSKWGRREGAKKEKLGGGGMSEGRVSGQRHAMLPGYHSVSLLSHSPFDTRIEGGSESGQMSEGGEYCGAGSPKSGCLQNGLEGEWRDRTSPRGVHAKWKTWREDGRDTTQQDPHQR